MKKSIITEDYEKLTALIISYREKAGLTQVQLADLLEETQSFVSKIERAERRIDLVELYQICSAMGIKLSEFCKDFEKQIERGEHAVR